MFAFNLSHIVITLLLTWILSRISSIKALHEYSFFRLLQFITKVVIFVVVTLLSSLIGIVISCCCYVLDKRHLTNYYTGIVYYQLASAALNVRCEIILPEAKFQFPDQCVVIANHQSSLDLFIMAYFWPQKLAVIAKESMKYYPILGWHLALAQNIFIRRQQRDKALQAMAFAAKKIVENKVGVFLFPEGTRSHTDKPDLLPFKKGAFHLATQAKVPIIPVVAASYGDIYSSKHFRFNDGVIMIKVLEPVPVDDHHVETVEQLMDQCRTKMQETLSELKCIQD